MIPSGQTTDKTWSSDLTGEARQTSLSQMGREKEALADAFTLLAKTALEQAF